MERKNLLTLALATTALLLLAVLGWEWNQGLRLKRNLLAMRNIPAVAAKPLNVLPEFTLPAQDAGFPELVSRSLFAINRRSSATANKGGVSAMKKGQFVLVGVVITPGQRSVQLRDVLTNKAETVALSGVVRGMTVGEVDASRIILRQGSESEELVLNVQTGSKGIGVSKAPTPMPMPAPAPQTAASAAATPASAPASAAKPPASSPIDVKKQR